MHAQMRLLVDPECEVWLFWVIAFGADDRFLPFLVTIFQSSLSMSVEWQVRVYEDVENGVLCVWHSVECRTNRVSCESRGQRTYVCD